MKGFKFKLQSVLEARNKKFEDAQLEFAMVQQRLNQHKKRLEYIYKELEQTTVGLELVMSSKNIDYTLIFCHQNYMVKLKQDIIAQKNLIKETEKELDEKNKKMLEALKEKTMMEKLREKAVEEFKKNIERLDMLNIDEIATNRYRKAG